MGDRTKRATSFDTKVVKLFARQLGRGEVLPFRVWGERDSRQKAESGKGALIALVQSDIR